MSPQDAVAYALSRQQELLPSTHIDKLVNSVSVTDGSAERSFTSQYAVKAVDIVANIVSALAQAGRGIGKSMSAPRVRVP